MFKFYSAQLYFIQHGAVDGDITVGGRHPVYRSPGQGQPAGQPAGDTDHGGPGIEEEGDRLAVDGAVGDVVAGAVALQHHFRRSGVPVAEHLLVRVFLVLEIITEKPAQQYQRQDPGDDDHPAAHSLGKLMVRIGSCHAGFVYRRLGWL